jgi:hypothetical protein
LVGGNTVSLLRRSRRKPITLKQATSQLQLSQAGLRAASAQYEHSQAEQSKAQHEQSMHAVTTLEPLVNSVAALPVKLQVSPFLGQAASTGFGESDD